MSAVPSAIASAIANIQQTDKVTPRPQQEPPKKAKEVRREVIDRVEIVDSAETVDAVKGLAGNEREDASEDHQEKAAPPPQQRRPRLDLEG
ncbi:MAG: hypothetical protein U0573_06915 [Phycisphaerales bacterium]|nr:hypothetical protein [Planctomycetota bacterium]